GSVTVTLDYFIAGSLKSSYDGVITMHFTGMEDGVNFLYKLTDTGLRLEDASKAPLKDGVVTARSASPMVLFFEKK
ncbi:MAG: SH3 domain-containing protein, partial [Treponema sp.]|nr:SH3 domain-containing protein [Treponema sp.]